MENLTVKEVLDLGATAVLAVGVIALWKRLTSITDRMFIYLEAAKRDRHEMRNEMNANRLRRDMPPPDAD